MNERRACRLPLAVGLLCVAAVGAAHAQRDLTGHWSQLFHEDLPERGAGPEIGDYTGLPVNDAARLQTILEKLPSIIEASAPVFQAVAEPLGKIDKIVMIDQGAGNGYALFFSA